MVQNGTVQNIFETVGFQRFIYVEAMHSMAASS